MNANNTSYWNTEESIHNRGPLEDDLGLHECTPMASAYSELDFQTMDQLRRLLALPQVEDLDLDLVFDFDFDLDRPFWTERSDMKDA